MIKTIKLYLSQKDVWSNIFWILELLQLCYVLHLICDTILADEKFFIMLHSFFLVNKRKKKLPNKLLYLHLLLPQIKDDDLFRKQQKLNFFMKVSIWHKADHVTSNFLKAVFNKFYLVHSWIPCSKFWNCYPKTKWLSKAYSELCKTSKMERFGKLCLNGFSSNFKHNYFNVPQSCIFSYIFDINCAIKEYCSVYHFADDTNLLNYNS